MLNTFTDSYDYYFTIRNRIVKNFSAFSFEGLYDIRFDVLNSYAMSLGLDTIQLSMRRWDSYLESVKTIWAATSKCVIAKERRFIFLLFENGEYLILNKKDFKEISSAHQKTDRIIKFGENGEYLLLIKYYDFDKEINGVHVTSYNFTFRLLFEIIFKQNLASYINKPYSFDIINRGMLSKLKMILKNFNNTPIVHSENDAILLYNILDNIYKNLSWEDVYLLEYVFSKEPKVFSWKTMDNNSKHPNMFVVECPIIGEKDKAIKNIKEQGKNIAKYCRKLLKDSEITSDIYKFLVFDRSIYTKDGRLMMYYCYKGDGKETEVE